jgi:transcriptional regulator with XRE-family HTH domain
MQPSPFDIAALGHRIRDLRKRRGLSLVTLSASSSVSISMLSAVERGQKVPTILVLSQIATALDTSIARLVDEETSPRVVLLRVGDQRHMDHPEGWERRTLSPVLPGVEFEFIRNTLAPGIDAGIFPPHRPGSREYLAVERGCLTVTLAGTAYALEAGDSLYHDGDCPHGYRNDGDVSCVYYLAMDIAGAR